MRWDEGLAQLLRDDLAGEPVTETRMFGGTAFMRAGHMVGGTYKGGMVFRVGKPNEAEAAAVPGAVRLTMNGRPMTGMIELGEEAAADDARRGRLLGLALSFVKGLPPK